MAPIAVVVNSERGIQHLIELLVEKSGLKEAEIARRMGIKHQSLNQYRKLRRIKPSVAWLARLAEATGARIFIEFPKRPLGL